MADLVDPRTLDVQQRAPLNWSFTAMTESVRRLVTLETTDVARSVAAVSEAVWWVTVVDAALIRHGAHAYEHALARLDPASRRAMENTLAGLRFVRNQTGYYADPADFIQPRPGAGQAASAPLAAWTWDPAPRALGAVPRQAKARDPSLYRQYRAQLAMQSVTEAISQAAAFLVQAFHLG
jgi:hypothetical protein